MEFPGQIVAKLSSHKKVLLRERKRHTARRVVSTPSVVLPGYPPGQDTPPARVPPWAGYPPGQGTPPGRVPPQAGYPPSQGTPPARVPPSQGTPQPGYPPGQGTPPAGPDRVPPSCPMAFWEMLQSIMGYGYPPGCEQTNKVKLLPSRRTTYAGGNNVSTKHAVDSFLWM